MTQARKPVCILKMGRTLPEIIAQRGDFEDWFRTGLGIGEDEIEVIDVFDGASIPDARDFSGVVITGSSAYVSDREDWSERAAAWIPEVIEAEKPLLGICYGHQLIAHALGGRVARNPNGREIGTVEVVLDASQEQTSLLEDLPQRLTVQVSHVESVLELPPGARLHGRSELDPHQIFSLGDRVWGLQFHPEFDAEIVRSYIEGRSHLLVEESLDPQALALAARDSEHGTKLLRRFMEMVRACAS